MKRYIFFFAIFLFAVQLQSQELPKFVKDRMQHNVYAFGTIPAKDTVTWVAYFTESTIVFEMNKSIDGDAVLRILEYGWHCHNDSDFTRISTKSFYAESYKSLGKAKQIFKEEFGWEMHVEKILE